MDIHLPTYEYIDQILILNRKYLITQLPDNQKQNGFIRIAYTRDDLAKIIAAREMVIATEQNRVIGYYLIGRKSGDPALDYQKNKARSLFDTHQIPFDKIGYGCQVCIEERYRNNGFFGQMLQALTQMVKTKYSHLLCSVSDDNAVSLQVHINNGWKLIGELEVPRFFIYHTQRPIIL